MSRPESFDESMFDDAAEDQLTNEQSQEPVKQYRKQGFSIYSMMLLLSFLFLTAASIIFFNFTE